ncbi:molybdenum cofactor guanylyltransferase [Desulfogranum marinum]|uniref:molybdenum cofactor guanylyltransferase n=1 Tax=Desulfogranum marinum TaxID=453220 RepID=UPI0029C74C11|nr:molybdenum cofactor guanylyltransferase [Desulfogranum marinum]
MREKEPAPTGLLPLEALPLLGICGGETAHRRAFIAGVTAKCEALHLSCAVFKLQAPVTKKVCDQLHVLCRQYDAVLVESELPVLFHHLWLNDTDRGNTGQLFTFDHRELANGSVTDKVVEWLGRRWLDAPVWGCVLVGGKSRRMGRAKHLIRHQGKTWLERTVEVLQHQTEKVIVSGAGELPDSLAELDQIADVEGLAGPIAGILAALRYKPEVSWLIVACDLPEMNEQALQWLLSRRRIGRHAVLADLEGNGRVEPLLAYYDYRCRKAVEDIVAAGSLRINRLQGVPGVFIDQPPASLRRCWRNINTPSDLARHR